MGLSTAEKLKAVFDYTRGHVRYVGNSDKSDWRKEAVRGFKTGKGDCFTFYSVT
ncbi:MAG: transglutaminase, partial [Clostridia bacterium]|nr:transglutaminase [Clostridia bacterium]